MSQLNICFKLAKERDPAAQQDWDNGNSHVYNEACLQEALDECDAVNVDPYRPRERSSRHHPHERIDHRTSR